jgi:hypothetical protein
LVVLKYRAESGYNSQMIGLNIREAVNKAAKLAGKVATLLQNPTKSDKEAVINQALSYHFHIDAADKTNVATIQRNFETVREGLSGLVCIADIDHRLPHAGYVPVRAKEQYNVKHGLELSPFATAGRGLMPKDEQKIEQDIVQTSIHVDYTLFGQLDKKVPLVTFDNDEEGQRRKAEHEAYAKLFYQGDFGRILMIHEATHKFCFTADHCYCKAENKTKYEALSPQMLMKNADSYAFLALSVWVEQVIKVREDAVALIEAV